ncbi:MAG: potassium channel family protein [Pseudodesulfovibrio sp.]
MTNDVKKTDKGWLLSVITWLPPRVEIISNRYSEKLVWILYPTSFTFWFIDVWKKKNEDHKQDLVKGWKAVFFVLSVLVFLSNWCNWTIDSMCWNNNNICWNWYSITVVAYLIFRCNEITYAFWSDSMDQISNKSSGSFTPKERFTFAVLSYIEVIMNMSVIYYIIEPYVFQKEISYPQLNALYFSVMTITTVGYGDISLESQLGKLLTVYEVAIGILLLVFSIGIYLNLSDKEKKPTTETKND